VVGFGLGRGGGATGKEGDFRKKRGLKKKKKTQTSTKTEAVKSSIPRSEKNDEKTPGGDNKEHGRGEEKKREKGSKKVSGGRKPITLVGHGKGQKLHQKKQRSKTKKKGEGRQGGGR